MAKSKAKTKSMAAGAKTRVVLQKPEELLAGLPSLLGFRPGPSLILIAAGPPEPRPGGRMTNVLGKCLRVDLPAGELREPVVQQVAGAMAADGPASVMAVVVGGGEWAEDRPPPHAELVLLVADELAKHEIRMFEAYWVAEFSAGARWCSYLHECCDGELPDPAESLVETELAARGHVTFGSRAEVEQLFVPDADLLMEARGDLIDDKSADLDAGRVPPWSTERGAAAVREGLKLARSGVLVLSDDLIAELALALADTKIRDSCLAMALPADEPLAEAAGRLWQALARALPAPERAKAASLAAYAAYMQGNGTLANVAVDAALDAEPSDVLAGLLFHALQRGMHPREFRRLGECDELGLCAQLRAAA